jgi:cysteine desulfurase / selenocysteine lyase
MPDEPTHLGLDAARGAGGALGAHDVTIISELANELYAQPPASMGAEPAPSQALARPGGWVPQADIGAGVRHAAHALPSGGIPGLPDLRDLRGLLARPSAPAVRGGDPGAARRSFLAAADVAATTAAPAPTFDVHAVRRDFPALHQTVHGRPLVWLDNAATTQKPQIVIDAVSSFYERDNSNVHRTAHALAARATEAYEGARRTVQRCLGARFPEEIVFVRGTTEGINLVAQTLGRAHLGPGDDIIVSELEHHANIVPWQLLARETGATLRVVPISDAGDVMLEAYRSLLGPRTKIVALAHASNTLGTILPVEIMTRMAKCFGAYVLIDGAQGVPHFRVNVDAIGCDFYAFSGHKLFGPTGVGALYGKAEVLRSMPPWQGGGNMIESVSFEATTYADIPHKFEAGTGILAGAVGLGAAIEYVSRLGPDRLHRYEHALLTYATEALTALPGIRLIGTAPHKVAVLSFVVDGARAEDVAAHLDRHGIAVRAGHHCAQPTMRRYGLTGTVRASLAFYNTREEIDALVQAVGQVPRPR